MKYKLEIEMDHVKKWWTGEEIYEFFTIDDVINFISLNFNEREFYLNLIRKRDSEKENGKIGSTSSYELTKY